jgi:hypothetical protein
MNKQTLVVLAAWALAQSLAVAGIAFAADVPHVSGGIGETEQHALRAREKEFNLKLVFTLVEGNFLSDVAVTLLDAKGETVLTHVSSGPFFLAKLPAGRYTVNASYEGRTVARRLQVGATALHTEYLRWPSTPGSDHPLPKDGAGARAPGSQSGRP